MTLRPNADLRKGTRGADLLVCAAPLCAEKDPNRWTIKSKVASMRSRIIPASGFSHSARGGYPDFTITDHARGITFYWEHLGLLDDPGYRARWERKRAEYLDASIKPLGQGDDSEGILIKTRDQPGGGLDAGETVRTIEKMLL